MRLWRITDARYATTAFSGIGASITGGRWNSPGTRIIYASENLSTAILELLVHVDPSNAPTTLVKIPLEVPDSTAHTVISIAALARGWQRYPAPPPLARKGDDWVARGQTALLFVPSAVVGHDSEPNVLINPQHPDFSTFVVGRPEALVLDPRLLK